MGNRHLACSPPFETRPFGSLLRVRAVGAPFDKRWS
jgi:hypothetical protein